MAQRVHNQVATGIPSASLDYRNRNRYDEARLIPPGPKQLPQQAPPTYAPISTAVVDAVFNPVQSARDTSTAKDRAWAAVIILLPYMAASILLGFMAMTLLYAVHTWFPFHPEWFIYVMLFLFCVFGGVTAAYTNIVDRTYEDSPISVEHHRIQAAEKVAKKAIKAEKELRMAHMNLLAPAHDQD